MNKNADKVFVMSLVKFDDTKYRILVQLNQPLGFRPN